jgi:hypothetical protein
MSNEKSGQVEWKLLLHSPEQPLDIFWSSRVVIKIAERKKSRVSVMN